MKVITFDRDEKWDPVVYGNSLHYKNPTVPEKKTNKKKNNHIEVN